MPVRRQDEQDIRKLTKVGQKSIAVTIPIKIVRELGWREKQKVVVRREGSGVTVRDWKK